MVSRIYIESEDEQFLIQVRSLVRQGLEALAEKYDSKYCVDGPFRERHGDRALIAWKTSPHEKLTDWLTCSDEKCSCVKNGSLNKKQENGL